jgi:hypothetical protein
VATELRAIFPFPQSAYNDDADAPTAEAVRKPHQALGIDLDPQAVVEVQVLT